MKMKMLGLFVGLALHNFSIGTVRAATLLGDVISGSYDYPCATCNYAGNYSYSSNPFTVDGTVETVLLGGNSFYYWAWDVDFNANSVTLTMAPVALAER